MLEFDLIVTCVLKSSCGARVRILSPLRSSEITVALLCVTSEQSLHEMDTQLTGMHCEPVTGDSDYPSVNSEKSSSDQWSHGDHWFTLKTCLMFVQPK